MTKLQAGDVFKVVPGMNINITDTQSILTVSDHNIDYIGTYVVTHTTFDGGGTGHGKHDVYPDGHHVWCQHLTNHDIKIDFYQSGSFISLNENVEIIGSARAEWKVND